MLSASSLVHAAPAIVGRQTPSALAHDSAAPAALYHRGLDFLLVRGERDLWQEWRDLHSAGKRARREAPDARL
jgi:hypothetical protein